MATPQETPRDLLRIIDFVSRATTNRDILTICEALRGRLLAENRQAAIVAMERASAAVRDLSKEIERLPKLSGKRATGVVLDDVGLVRPERAGQSISAVLDHAADGRKPARGKAKRSIAKTRKARKADK